MVPDPSRGGPFSKTNVASEVYGTLAHEYQHLINASRRMYVNTAATDFEETWLDEGLAHEAEELLFYRVSGLRRAQNIDPTAIRQSAAIVSAFNNYQSENFGRYEEYLGSPSRFSPYTPTTIRWRCAAHHGRSFATPPTIAARPTPTPGTSSSTRRRPAWRTCRTSSERA